jgi:hypothetical protein
MVLNKKLLTANQLKFILILVGFTMVLMLFAYLYRIIVFEYLTTLSLLMEFIVLAAK